MTHDNSIKFLTINSKSKWKSKILDHSKDHIHVENLLRLGTFKNVVFDSQTNLSCKNIISISVDDCNVLFMLFYNIESGKYGICTVNPETGFEELTYPSLSEPVSIHADSQFLYVLDANTIKIIKKIDYSYKTIQCVGENPCDITLDVYDHLLLLDKNNQIYIYENEEFKPFLDEKSSSKIQENGAIKCQIGKYDDKLYTLGTHNILVFSSDGYYENTINLDSADSAVDFDVFDSDNLFVMLKNRFMITILDGINNPINLTNITRYDHVAVSKSGMIYIVDTSANKINSLKHIDNFYDSAFYITKPFDSTINDTIWHKITLDCDILPNTVVDIFYYSSNSSDLPMHPSWQQLPPNPYDALLVEAKGRYLWIKINLSSLDGILSPKVHSIKVFFPRSTYLKYLPSLYSKDKKSKDFLERFLSIFETIQSSIDEKITSIPKYLDPRSTPNEYLSWLSMWFAFEFDQTWNDKKLRMLLESLPQIYKGRGTRQSLEYILSIYLGLPVNLIPFFQNQKFVIVEHFQIKTGMNLDHDYKSLYGDNPYSFFILLNSLEVKRDLVDHIRKIVYKEKPAHTIGHVVMIEPWFELNSHTYLGVNTYLNKKILTIGESKLGRDSIVSEK